MSNLATLPANQSALPSAWVDRLFDRFATMYGKHWYDQWAGIPLERVKQTWAEDLAFASAEQLKRSLEHCKTNSKFPPTCPEFAGLCKAFSPAIESGPLALPPVRYGEIDPKVRAEIAKFLTAGKKRDPKDWARSILKEHAEGTYRFLPGINCAKRALGLVR